jgi:hypothetical protein
MRSGRVPVDVDLTGFLGATLSYYRFMRRKSHSRQVISHYAYLALSGASSGGAGRSDFAIFNGSENGGTTELSR